LPTTSVMDREPAAPTEPASRARVVPRRTAFLGLAALVVIVNVGAAFGVDVPFVTPFLGVVAVVGVPTFVFYGANPARWRRPGERLALSLVTSLLLIVGAALVANTILPLVGDHKPLGPGTIFFVVDVMLLLLAKWSYPRHPSEWVLSAPSLPRRSKAIITLSASLVVLAIMGAVRLNNGASGSVTGIMLGVAVVLIAFLVLLRDELGTGVMSVSLFFLGLSLLFMTSLRGWHTTGHDVQQEMFVFLLTQQKARWSIAAFRSPYNACLSITILPTVLAAWTRISNPYVYKVLFQLLFAVCPVMVYQLALRVASKTVALLAALYFVAFVTFYQDMPMLNRQEISFLFFAAALLVLFQDEDSIRRRRIWFCVFGLGMVLSHYSTTYMAIAAFVVTWLTGVILGRLAPRVLRRTGKRDRRGAQEDGGTDAGAAAATDEDTDAVVGAAPARRAAPIEGFVTADERALFVRAFGEESAAPYDAITAPEILGSSLDSVDRARAQITAELNQAVSRRELAFQVVQIAEENLDKARDTSEETAARDTATEARDTWREATKRADELNGELDRANAAADEASAARRRGLLDVVASRRRVLSFLPIAFLIAASMLWTTPLTHTNDRLSLAFSATLRDLTGGPDVRSTDTSFAVLNVKGVSAKQVFKEYQEAVGQVRSTDPNAYYSDSTLNRYPTPLLRQQRLPLTAIGRAMQSVGVDVASLLARLHITLAALIQIFLVVGLVSTVRRIVRGPTTSPLVVDLLLLSMSLTLILAAQVLLPTLSLDYGVLRAFEQALLVVAVVVVWGAQAFTPRRFRRAGIVIPTVALLAYFITGSGLLTQIVGGYPAQLHLNNSGPYYEQYYVSAQEIAGAQWVGSHYRATKESPGIQVDTYTANRMLSFSGLNTIGDIYPGLVKKGAWVFLPASALTTGTATIALSFNGYSLDYHYPVDFLDNEKDLVYDSGSNRVYR